jgi:hypothetical protein
MEFNVVHPAKLRAGGKQIVIAANRETRRRRCPTSV